MSLDPGQDRSAVHHQGRPTARTLSAGKVDRFAQVVGAEHPHLRDTHAGLLQAGARSKLATGVTLVKPMTRVAADRAGT